MDLNMLKLLGSGTKLLGALPFSMLKSHSSKDYPVRSVSSWDEEKDDILERANWLCREIIVDDPEKLIQKMPSQIGREYQGQWAIYCCSMLAFALANISRLYPDKMEKCPELIAKLIRLVNTPTIRYYDTMLWHEDAMKTLAGEKSHMTYLSILAWMITNYKMIGGDGQFDALLDTLCETLKRRMIASPYDLNLLSFPFKQIFVPDMLVSIVALHNYAQLNDGKYADTVEAWLHNAKTKWIHKRTGLLAGMLPGAGRFKSVAIRGSYSALNCSYLSLVDEAFAREQYEKMKAVLGIETSFMGAKLCGVREYVKKTPKLSMKAGDAGLVVNGLSAGGTAFALGAATRLGDWEFRSKMLRTADAAGGTVKEKGMRHYRLGEVFMVGEATALAMRTMAKSDDLIS